MYFNFYWGLLVLSVIKEWLTNFVDKLNIFFFIWKSKFVLNNIQNSKEFDNLYPSLQEEGKRLSKINKQAQPMLIVHWAFAIGSSMQINEQS